MFITWKRKRRKKFIPFKKRKWYEKPMMKVYNRRRFVRAIEKYRNEINIEFAYWHDLKVMSKEMLLCGTNRFKKLDVMIAHDSYNPLVNEFFIYKYDPLGIKLFSFNNFCKFDYNLINPDYFIPNFATIREKYESGELQDEFELYSTIAAYVEYYKIRTKGIMSYLFLDIPDPKILTYSLNKRLPGRFHFLPDYKFNEIKISDIDHKDSVVIQKPKGLHSYMVFDALGVGTVYLETNLHDFTSRAMGPSRKLCYNLNNFGYKNIVLEGICALRDKENDVFLDVYTHDIDKQYNHDLRHNYECKQRVEFFAFDIFDIEELREGKINNEYSERLKRLENLFGWYDSTVFHVCEHTVIKSKKQVADMIRVCKELNGKTYWDGMIFKKLNDMHDDDISCINF